MTKIITNEMLDKIPENIRHLTFGLKYNVQIDKLPMNMSHLTFGIDLNKDKQKVLTTDQIFESIFNKKKGHSSQRKLYHSKKIISHKISDKQKPRNRQKFIQKYF